MKLHPFIPASLAAALLTACGGGGDPPPPTVSIISAGAATYSQTLVVTATGSNLDQGLSASSTGCRNFALGNTAPYVSTPTTAYILCTVSAVGTQQFTLTRTADGSALASTSFSVAVPQVTMAFSNGAGVVGTFVVTLDPARAPVTVDNFLAYVGGSFYTGTVIHRHAPGFVLQGGGYAGPLVAGGTLPTLKTTRAPIALEDASGLSNLRYTLSMARTNVPDSATSQFFINLADNTSLDRTATARGYAVFGTITTGTALVTAMASAPCVTWPAFLDTSECLPSPNLTITGAIQTR